MEELLEKWNEYRRWVTENYLNGYVNANHPTFEEFMSWCEAEEREK